MLTPDDYYEIQRELLDVQSRVWEVCDHLGRLNPNELACIRELLDAVDKLGIDVGIVRYEVLQMSKEACNEQ